jgi:ATP-dependent helicase Lhr and Lhr-like helicase
MRTRHDRRGRLTDPPAESRPQLPSPTRMSFRQRQRPDTWVQAGKELRDHLVLPEVDDRAVAGLKFSDALPRHLAATTLAARLADLEHAADLLAEPVRFER